MLYAHCPTTETTPASCRRRSCGLVKLLRNAAADSASFSRHPLIARAFHHLQRTWEDFRHVPRLVGQTAQRGSDFKEEEKCRTSSSAKSLTKTRPRTRTSRRTGSPT